MTDDAITELLLVGYVAQRSEGLALPCYASGPQSNAWYCARCSIDGDHEGHVSGFEPFEGDGIEQLPEQAWRTISVGDPWHDVLLLDGGAYVGTPDLILAELEDRVAELESAAPLTLLDLAMASGSLDRSAIAGSVLARLDTLWGSEIAREWQTETFVRQRVMLIVRRLLAPFDNAPDAAAVNGIEIDRDGDHMSVALPPRLAGILSRRHLKETYFEQIREFAAAVDIALTPETAAVDPASSGNGPQDAQSGKATSPVTSADPDQHNCPVLILFSGSKARTVMRHVTPPGWFPDWAGHKSDNRPVPLDILELEQGLLRLEEYSLCIWVTDDDNLAKWGPAISSRLDTIARGKGPPCILAPVLPPQQPAMALADIFKPKGIGDFPVLLDTAAVRSPFWTGNPKRSIDRRLGDLIAATATVARPGTPLHDWIVTNGSPGQSALLSIASGLRTADERLGLASEVSAAGLRKIRGETKELVWREISTSRPIECIGFGVASLRSHVPAFEAFAREVVKTKYSHLRNIGKEPNDIPVLIAATLRFPHLSATAQTASPYDRTVCAITAEAPNLETLRAGADEGWAVIRYSDEEALEAVKLREDRRAPALPSEISMPRLNRLGRNRGLAIRGVDPRDIVRIGYEGFSECRERFPTSDLVRNSRLYRSSLDRGAAHMADAAVAAIPALQWHDIVASEDPAAPLLRRFAEKSPASYGLLSKRTFDLRASWAPPRKGTTRLMIEDGRLPVRIAGVGGGEVVAQKYFTIDGDRSAALLFSSRLFRIWANVTMTRSPSWSSRFSITRTFETFPIPEQFSVRTGRQAGRASLYAPPDSSGLSGLLEDADYFLEEQEEAGHQGSGIIAYDEDFQRRFDDILIQMIGLAPDASDLDLLERMTEMNRFSGG